MVLMLCDIFLVRMMFRIPDSKTKKAKVQKC